MKAFIFGAQLGSILSDLPDYVSQIVLSDKSLADSVPECGASITLINIKLATTPEYILDSLSEAIEDPDPYAYMARTAMPEDLVFMAWDDSDEMYRHLRVLTDRGVSVFDTNDNYRELEIGKPDIDQIVELVTERVLKAVRAELSDTPTRRRSRSSAKKV